MNRSVIGWIFAFVFALGGSAFAWVWFAGGSGEPSTELTTPTIVGAATTSTVVNGWTTESVSTLKTYVIDSSQSVASFEIDEVLRGSPNRVFGQTNEVAG